MSRLYDHGGNIFNVARALGVTIGQMSDFSASINPLGMSPCVREAIISSIDSLIHYPDAGHVELKQVLAEYHDLSPAHFTIANGSTELIYHLPDLFSGKKALIISPAFSEYDHSLHQHGWDVQHFILSPDNNFSIDTEELERALSCGVDLLYCCNPGNPHGTLYPLQQIEAIHRLCQLAGTFLVLDEAFMDFCEEGSAKHLLAGSGNALILRSMTKFFGIPGLRLGYAITSVERSSQLHSIGGPWSVNTLAMVAGVEALQDVNHIQKTLDYVSKERFRLCTGLEQFKRFRVFPSNANYLLVEIREGITSGELQERLLQHHILIRSCCGFIGLSDHFFRIAVRTVEENDRLLEFLDRMMM